MILPRNILTSIDGILPPSDKAGNERIAWSWTNKGLLSTWDT